MGLWTNGPLERLLVTWLDLLARAVWLMSDSFYKQLQVGATECTSLDSRVWSWWFKAPTQTPNSKSENPKLLHSVTSNL